MWRALRNSKSRVSASITLPISVPGGPNTFNKSCAGDLLVFSIVLARCAFTISKTRRCWGLRGFRMTRRLICIACHWLSTGLNPGITYDSDDVRSPLSPLTTPPCARPSLQFILAACLGPWSPLHSAPTFWLCLLPALHCMGGGRLLIPTTHRPQPRTRLPLLHVWWGETEHFKVVDSFFCAVIVVIKRHVCLV